MGEAGGVWVGGFAHGTRLAGEGVLRQGNVGKIGQGSWAWLGRDSSPRGLLRVTCGARVGPRVREGAGMLTPSQPSPIEVGEGKGKERGRDTGG